MFGWFKRKKKVEMYPIEAVSKASFLEGEMFDRTMEESDPEKTFLAIALVSLGLGFSDVRRMEKVEGLAEIVTSTNVDILAFDTTLFYMLQCERFLQRIADGDTDYYHIDEDYVDEVVLDHFMTARMFVHSLYAKYYDEDASKKFMNGAVSEYILDPRSIAHEVFASRTLRCVGMTDFLKKNDVEIGLQAQILLGVHAMGTYTHMIPAYFESMNTILERFIDFELPVPGKTDE
ncbi:hypothetical protein [Pseudodesulfovibrio sp.]|uniref:hypothetical protein n=1 Tax=unclassified Pseudodesulfovibrio TaxID=2661612 RepID=UPI003B00EBAF